MKIETQKQKQLVEEIIEMLEGFKDEDYLLNPDTSIALLNSVQKKLQQALEEKRMKEGMAYYNLQEAEGGEAMNKEELKEKLIKKFNGGEYVMTYEVIAELCMEAIQELEEAEEEEDKVIIAGREYVPKQQLKEEREKRVDNRYLLERFRKRLEEKKERIDGLEQQREMMGQEIEWRKNNEEALKQEVEGLERKLESKNNRVEELEEKLGKRNKELRAIKSALDSDNPVKELAKQKETTQYWGQEAMRLENLLKEKDQKIEELEEMLEQERSGLAGWNPDKEMVMKQNRKLHQKNWELKQKIQQLKEEKEEWIWMPHAAHLGVANDCNFRLATYVGDYIVSTVGEYYPPHRDEMDTIGLNRKYETMVFEAEESDECPVCPYVMANTEQLDFKGYNDSKSAYRGHLDMCEKWSSKDKNQE